VNCDWCEGYGMVGEHTGNACREKPWREEAELLEVSLLIEGVQMHQDYSPQYEVGGVAW
jgi:hypothetical protein